MSKRIIMTAVLTLALVLSFAATAFAASDDIVISATVNSKITVTAPDDYDFGLVEPDAGVQTYSDVVNVRSNVAYTMAQSESGDTSNLFSTSGDAMDGISSNAKAPSAAGHDWAQTWSFDPAPGGVWADATGYSATYLYTAVAF